MELLEIAAILSDSDPAVLAEMEDCVDDPLAYAEERYDCFALRFFGQDLELIEPEALAWIGLVECLEENDYVCERDWKDELPDFVHFLKTRRGMARLGLTLEESWMDPDDDISEWIEVINARWAEQECCVAVIDINSDSYVLFPCTLAQRDRLRALAAQLDQRIE